MFQIMNPVTMMWSRQLKRHFRSRARLIGSLGQPLLFLIALGYGFGPIFQKAGGGDYLQFLTPGVVAMGILFSAVFTGIEIIWDRQFGFLKETLVAPVSRFEIVAGRTLGGATVALTQGLAVLVISLIAGFRPVSLSMAALSLVFMALIAIIFTALGTAIASLLEDMQGFQIIMNFIVMPIFFFSGALFPITGLPAALDLIARLDPLSYGVDGLRYSLTGITHLGIGWDLAVLSIWGVILMIIANYLFSKIQV